VHAATVAGGGVLVVGDLDERDALTRAILVALLPIAVTPDRVSPPLLRSPPVAMPPPFSSAVLATTCMADSDVVGY
jgi:hypothetical protein